MNFVEMKLIPHEKMGRELLAHQGGMWAIQKAWVKKFAKKLHEGCQKMQTSAKNQ
jgi:hypothetical protein